MAFKRSEIPGEDIRRGMEMAGKRRQLIEESPATPIIYDFGVNRLARSLHPGHIKARIVSKEKCGSDSCRIVLRSEKGEFPYFRAGQFITLSKRVGDSFLTRPYSIASSPREALAGRYEIIVQKKGIFSKYLIEEAGIDEEIIVGEPSGDFYYDDLRDKRKLLAIAGGSGITPFLSMLKAIKEGSEDFEMTLLYGVRSREHIVFSENKYRCEQITIIPVLSDEECEGYLHGLIDRELLGKYADEDTSVFMCGPDAMYDFVEKELKALGFAGPVRKERNSVGDRQVNEEKIFKLKVHVRDEVHEIEARSSETIVTSLERAGIAAPVRCKNGICGFCHSRVIAGRYHVREGDDHRRAADIKFDYIHPCVTYPESDMEIDVPYLDI